MIELSRGAFTYLKFLSENGGIVKIHPEWGLYEPTVFEAARGYKFSESAVLLRNWSHPMGLKIYPLMNSETLGLTDVLLVFIISALQAGITQW